MRLLRSGSYLAVFVLLLGASLWGQATSQIQGVVLDPAGAAVPAAEIKATQVETQSTGIGGVIENKRILELPLNGRNAVELIALAGATIPAGRNGTAGMPGGLNFSVAGGLLSGIGYSLDGTAYNNLFDAV